MGTPLLESGIAVVPPDDSPQDAFVIPQGMSPIRADLLGLERLEACARRLAAACKLAPPRREGSPLLREFAENERALVRAHVRIAAPGGSRGPQGLDAEWLADNFHVIEEVLREVRKDLPRGYDAELPKLACPPLAGYPRVYALALILVAHTDSELDETKLLRLVSAFQETTPLTIGELWALPTMLRLVLLENLRRLAQQALWGWDERGRAERWAVETLDDEHDGEPVGGAAVQQESPSDFSDPVRRAAPPALPGPAPAGGRGPGAAPVGAGRPGRGRQRGPAPRAPAPGGEPDHGRQLRPEPPALSRRSTGTPSSSAAAPWRRSCGPTPRGSTPSRTSRPRDRYRRAAEKVSRGAKVDELEVARAALEFRGGRRRAGRGPRARRLLPRRPRPGCPEGEAPLPARVQGAHPRVGPSATRARPISGRWPSCWPRSSAGWRGGGSAAWRRRGGCRWRCWRCCCR
jgi:cyclic beta-1,2-glucan synthetase